MKETNLIFKKISKFINDKNIKLIVIGDNVRKGLYLKIFNKKLKDDSHNQHIDLLVKSNYSIRNTKLKFYKIIQNLRLKKHKNKISYRGNVGKFKIELVGIIIKEKLYYCNFAPTENRPDITIERIGFYENGQRFDGLKRGFKDFNEKRIIINPLWGWKSIPVEKALKIIQIKFQTGFIFDKKTKKLILDALENANNKTKSLINLINLRNNTYFKNLDEIKEVILQDKA